MDNEKCLHLIDLYRKHPVLWNSKVKNYHNKNSREETWEEISSILGVPVVELKQKLKSLMGTYRREKSRQNLSRHSGKRNVYVSKWFAYGAFAFLSDRNSSRKAMDIPDEKPSSTSQRELSQVSQHSVNTPATATTSYMVSQENDSSEIPQEPPFSVRHKKRMTSPNEGIMLKDALSLLQKTADASMDSYVTYGQYITNELRKYDPRTLAIVKQSINNVIFEADMGSLAPPDVDQDYSHLPLYSPAPSPNTVPVSPPSPQSEDSPDVKPIAVHYILNN